MFTFENLVHVSSFDFNLLLAVVDLECAFDNYHFKSCDALCNVLNLEWSISVRIYLFEKEWIFL